MKVRTDPTGKTVKILSGEYQGLEGVCLGRILSKQLWAISPDGSTRIVQLSLGNDFIVIAGKKGMR